MWMIFNLVRVWKFTRKIARKIISVARTGRPVQCPGSRKYCFPNSKKSIEKAVAISLTSRESAHVFISSTGMRFDFNCQIAWVLCTQFLDHFDSIFEEFNYIILILFDLNQISLAWLHFTLLHFFIKLLSLLDFGSYGSGT